MLHQNSLLKALRLAAMLIAPALLSGCAETLVGIASVCPAWKRITISKHDALTDGTARQIEGNNVARKAIGCEDSNG